MKKLSVVPQVKFASIIRQLNEVKENLSLLEDQKKALTEEAFEMLEVGKDKGIVVDDRLYYKTSQFAQTVDKDYLRGDCINLLTLDLPNAVQDEKDQKALLKLFRKHEEVLHQTISTTITAALKEGKEFFKLLSCKK